MNKINIYRSLVKYLPKKLRYEVVFDMLCETTTGEYSNTFLPELTAMEMANRFDEKHKLFKK